MNDQRGFDPDAPDAEMTDDSSAIFKFDPSGDVTPFDEFGSAGERRGLFDDVPDLGPGDPPSFGSEGDDVFRSLGDEPPVSPFAPGADLPPAAPGADDVEPAFPFAVDEPAADPGAGVGAEPAFRFDDGGGDPTGSLPHWTDQTGVLDTEAIAAVGDITRTAEEERLEAWAT